MLSILIVSLITVIYEPCNKISRRRERIWTNTETQVQSIMEGAKLVSQGYDNSSKIIRTVTLRF